jgi:hypothetical protein
VRWCGKAAMAPRLRVARERWAGMEGVEKLVRRKTAGAAHRRLSRRQHAGAEELTGRRTVGAAWRRKTSRLLV